MSNKGIKVLITIAVVIVMFLGLYAVAIFSNIPIIKQLRTYYIETAMSTMSHQWLATDFIPQPIIDEVLKDRDAAWAAQSQLESKWGNKLKIDTKAVDISSVTTGEEGFFNKFIEVDKNSFREYIAAHPDVVANGYENMLIDESSLDSQGTSIKTTAGDQVLTIDAANGILIIRVTGQGYTGKLAIVKDPSKVRLGTASSLGSFGKSVKDIAVSNNSILAINASGFADKNGVGNGGTVVGLLISGGQVVDGSLNSDYMMIGFQADNRLYIGHMNDISKFRDAVEFFPAEVINGVDVTSGSDGFGIQPRTSIGQKANGDVLLLTIDGRQVGYSLGCTVGDCANILLRYKAEQASNLDGGSSTVMVYRGNEITKPANGFKFGRYVPDAFVVDYTKEN